MYKNIVIIPAYNPPERMIKYIDDLIMSGMEHILLVNDGSSNLEVFEHWDSRQEIEVYSHAKNLGKGRALKNAFNYCINKYMKGNDEISGVITVDCDGQHTVADVIHLQKMLDKRNVSNPALILGVRKFDSEDIPFKSRFGNKITEFVFWLLYGVHIYDTQTGLRAISKEYLIDYMDLRGERFEYETSMLIYAAQHKQTIEQIEIKTLYFDNNEETHFRPIMDSVKIYSIILGSFIMFGLSSLFSLLIDLTLFQVFIVIFSFLTDNMMIFLATLGARVISSICNFYMNRCAVFKKRSGLSLQIVRYYVLCIVQLGASALGVIVLHSLLLWPKVLEKMIVDTCLFFISYQIQRRWVFK